MDSDVYNSIINDADQRIQYKIQTEAKLYAIKMNKFYIILSITLIVSVILFIVGIVVFNFKGGFAGCFLSSIGVVAPIIVFSMRPRKTIIDKKQELCKEIKENIICYWSEIFDESVESINYDLTNFITRNKKLLGVETRTIYTQFRNPATNRINTRSELVNIEWFWLDKSKVDFVYNKCCEKYHKKSTSSIKENLSIQKSQLQNENLSLKNETLKIKINLIKPWTCQFCGNMNRADDMSCLKCGGIRPS